MWLEEIVQEEIDQGKLKGLEATREAINTWNHNQEYNWQLLEVSNQTAHKLIQGEFKTLEELEEFSLKNETETTKIEILYRKIINNNREENIYIIETIFINE
ncbi:MAG: hypothetical protein L3J23_08855 [Flavobacteriaceae bacterium]|nr:hypothetical protein [Flavobacteriaceae bacterium]